MQAEGEVFPALPRSLVHFSHQAYSLCPREREVLTLVAEVRESSRQHG